jgi:NADPH:quinone reductase
MRAIAVTGYGETPTLMKLPVPEPGPGQLLVELYAASINPLDWKIADGELAGRWPARFPLILGTDGAGTVVQAPEAGSFTAGDRVCGQFLAVPVLAGTYAEYLATDWRLPNGAVCAVPSGIPDAAAAVLPTAGMTALAAMDALAVREGHRVLIVGATGGVGMLAVQLAAARGAHVIATARPDAAEQVRKLGAVQTVDYSQGRAAPHVRQHWPSGVDALFDLVSDKAAFAEYCNLVKDGGIALSAAFAASPPPGADRISIGNLVLSEKQDLLERFLDEFTARQLSIQEAQVVTLAEAPAALARHRAGGARGKTMISIR